MKNSPVSALVLLGVATLVGGVTWFAVDDDRIPGESKVVAVEAPEAAGPRVMNLTPFEQRKKGRLEAARREIEEYKQTGKVLDNGAIRVKDVDGSPLYIHPELIEGVGRYGEPLYAMAKYKRRAAVPLREKMPVIKQPEAQPIARRLKPGQSPLDFGKKPADSASTPTDMGGSNDGQDGQSGKKPGPIKDG